MRKDKSLDGTPPFFGLYARLRCPGDIRMFDAMQARRPCCPHESLPWRHRNGGRHNPRTIGAFSASRPPCHKYFDASWPIWFLS
jgi:hypothetical protein